MFLYMYHQSFLGTWQIFTHLCKVDCYINSLDMSICNWRGVWLFYSRLRSMAHRDHVVRRRRRRPSVLSSHFSFPFNNFWRDVWISFKFCKTENTGQFDIGNHPPNFGWVMTLFRLSFCCSFPLNNFWRVALISFKLCRTLYQRKIQVKFDIGNHPPNLAELWPFFDLDVFGVLILVSDQ